MWEDNNMHDFFPLKDVSHCEPSELCGFCKIIRLFISRAIIIHKFNKYGEVILYDTKPV